MVTIAAQFNGPDRSGNGGYVAGLLGAELGSTPATSTLRLPPPLDVPLSWDHEGEELRLLTAGGAIVGAARAGAFVREPPPCPTGDQAAAGLAAYPGFHPPVRPLLHVWHPARCRRRAAAVHRADR